MDTKTLQKKDSRVEEALDYPGVATNRADHDKTDKSLVKEDVKDLNNNPRNNEIDKG